MVRRNKLYFYKKTIAPDNYDFYSYATGIAGFKKLQTKMGECIFSGTIEEMEAYYKEQRDKQPKRGYDIYKRRCPNNVRYL